MPFEVIDEDEWQKGFKRANNGQLSIAPQLVFAVERNVQTCATIQR
jgi:hypothetical protein